MTKEQRRALADLLRRYADMMAERLALRTLLDWFTQESRPPDGWRLDLQRLKESDEYLAQAHQFDQQIAALEKAAEDNDEELIDTLQRFAEGKLPN